MSRPNLINSSQVRMPRKFLTSWNLRMTKALGARKVGPRHLRVLLLRGEWSVVFLDPGPARKLNLKYRKKNYATDVLSFSSEEPDSLGELVICPQVVRRQACEHGLTFQEELGYMVLHGVLHLLGYDHETSPEDEKRMMGLQDDLFDVLCRSLLPSRKRRDGKMKQST